MTSTYFRCMACGDTRPVSATRTHCLCGAVSARSVDDAIVLAGPGRVGSATPEDRDGTRVIRPSVAVGT
jgi:hypothetical protein